MKESMERQKEMVQAIVIQRDMYRTLLAQSTPLPGESSLSMSLSTPRGLTRGSRSAVGRPGDVDDFVDGEEEGAVKESVAEARKALEEMREQFEAYRKEKSENDSIIQQQIDKLREECSEVKIERAKLASKVRRVKEDVAVFYVNVKMLVCSYKNKCRSCVLFVSASVLVRVSPAHHF